MKQMTISQLFCTCIFILVGLAVAAPLAENSRTKRSSTVAEFTLQDSQPLNDTDEIVKKQEADGTYPGTYTHDCNNVITDPAAPVYQRSSCPWYYENNKDVRRYPRNIPVAKLRCGQSCIGADPSYECAPINQAMTVLEQSGTDTEGKLVYREKEFYVIVGYTCASKKVTESGSNTSGSQSTSDSGTAADGESEDIFEK